MSEPLSILEVVFSSAWGGLEMLAGQFACWFQSKGHKVIVVASPNRFLERYLVENNVCLQTMIPVLRYYDLFTAVRLARIIKNNGINIIHAHISRDLSTLALAKKIAGKGALIFTQHMDSRYPKKDIFHRWIYSGVDMIITATDAMREHQLAFSPAKPEQVKRIYNGIDAGKFQPGKHVVPKLLERYQIPQGRKIISVIARLDRLKNQRILIEAAPDIIRVHPEVLFLFAGKETPSRDGLGYRHELETAIRIARLDDYFRFLGFCEQIDEIIALSDLVALTTPKESFGLVLIESMAMEKAVVAARGGGAVEIITDGITGKLFVPGQAGSLADAINTILNSPSDALCMGKKGRADVLQRFSLQKNFELYEKEFYNTLDQK